MERRDPHLGSEPAALEAAAEPRPGLERAHHREPVGEQVRRSHDVVAFEAQRTADSTTPGRSPHVTASRSGARCARARVTARPSTDRERHRVRVVDARRGQRRQLDGELVVEVAHGETRRAHARGRTAASTDAACAQSDRPRLPSGPWVSRAPSWRRSATRPCPTSSVPGSSCCSSASTPGCGRRRRRPTSRIPGNRFYPALRMAGVIERDIDRGVGMSDADRAHLIERGIGITNVVARATSRASELSVAELQRRRRATAAIRARAPAARRRPRRHHRLPRRVRRRQGATRSPAGAASRAPSCGSCPTRAGSTPTRRSPRWPPRTANRPWLPVSSTAGRHDVFGAEPAPSRVHARAVLARGSRRLGDGGARTSPAAW